MELPSSPHTTIVIYLTFYKKNYCAGACNGEGAVGVVFGVGFVGADFAASSVLVFAFLFSLALGMATTVSIQRAKSTIALPQVPFSKTSPVLCTPITFDAAPEKPPAIPFPFGFCTITISIINKLTNMINIEINVYIMLDFLNFQFGFQRYYFFLDISTLIFCTLQLLYLFSLVF
jgi:hypothetical protein